MIFFSWKEFKGFWNGGARVVVGVILLVLFASGFIVGVFNSDDPTNCTYDSWATRVNIAYIAGCEIYRPRFRKPCGFKKTFSITHPTGWNSSYNLVTFEDGTTKTMEIDTAFSGKAIRSCE